jgi:hypothetical protein
MAAASTSYINLNVLPTGWQGAAEDSYTININSLGGTSTLTTPKVNLGSGAWDVLGDIITIWGDVDTLTDPSASGIIGMLYGLGNTAAGAYDSLQNNAVANTSYGAAYKGIQVTASASLQESGAKLTLVEGDTSGLLYQVQSPNPATGWATSPNNNWLLVTTWRQTPTNTGEDTSNLSSCDLLIVAVLNEGLYSANNLQQYLNSSPSTATAKARYKPTKEQAADSMKIMGILTAIAKTNSSDAQYIVEMFGVQGNYTKIKSDPLALKNLKIELIKIFEKNKNALPMIAPFLTKLEQKA